MAQRWSYKDALTRVPQVSCSLRIDVVATPDAVCLVLPGRVLTDDTLVLPAHDYEGRTASTIGREKKSNPRLQLTSAPDFAAAMAANQVGIPPPSKLREALSNNLKCL